MSLSRSPSRCHNHNNAMMVPLTATLVLDAAAGMTEGALAYRSLVAAVAGGRPLGCWTPSPGAAPQAAGAVSTGRVAGADDTYCLTGRSLWKDGMELLY